jgi:hypothetical protein
VGAATLTDPAAHCTATGSYSTHCHRRVPALPACRWVGASGTKARDIRHGTNASVSHQPSARFEFENAAVGASRPLQRHASVLCTAVLLLFLCIIVISSSSLQSDLHATAPAMIINASTVY